ncbi:hypothetical protein B0I37DRAFT_405367, partial [Chaetomium sp. MPI-CAGE-AT-0009]
MMRRGLWQQKQNRPSACLLCRFSYGYGPYTRPALRPSSSSNDGVIDLGSSSNTPSPAPSSLTRSYTVAISGSRHGDGGLGGTSGP